MIHRQKSRVLGGRYSDPQEIFYWLRSEWWRVIKYLLAFFRTSTVFIKKTTYVHILSFLYIRIHSYTYIYVCVCARICVCMCVHEYLYVCMWVFVCMNVYIFRHVYFVCNNIYIYFSACIFCVMICTYIYIYIVIHRQTVSFYQNSSVWLDTQDRNPSNFTLDCVSDHSSTKRTTLAKGILRYFYFLETAAAAFVYIFLYPIGYQSAQFFRRALHYASGGRQFLRQWAQPP